MPAGKVRLQKFLSDAGVAARRKAEELIEKGFVLVNNEVVDTLPAFIDPERDRVVVKGSVVRAQPLTYVILNKPKNVVSSSATRVGRKRVVDLVEQGDIPLHPVGRLDPDASGLVLLTNDGELANLLAHPAAGVPRRYEVEVRGEFDEDLLSKLERGVFLAEGKARVSNPELNYATPDRSQLLVTTHDQAPRLIPRLFAKLGFQTKALRRIEFGPLRLKGLAEGASRPLSAKEISALRIAVADVKLKPKRRRPRSGGPAGPAREGRRPRRDDGDAPRRRIIS